MSKIAKSPFKNKRNRPKANTQQGEYEGDKVPPQV